MSHVALERVASRARGSATRAGPRRRRRGYPL